MTPMLPPISWTMFRGTTPLPKERWVEFINRAVNGAIDFDPNGATGSAEEWHVAPKVGVCHDYAVTKREMLLHFGYHSGELILAECKLTDGQHHLVLIVNGMVLDSLTSQIKPRDEVRYEWVREQSIEDPNAWET